MAGRLIPDLFCFLIITITTNCKNVQTVDPEICSIFFFLEKVLGLTSLSHSVYDFSRKLFLIIYSELTTFHCLTVYTFSDIE